MEKERFEQLKQQIYSGGSLDQVISDEKTRTYVNELIQEVSRMVGDPKKKPPRKADKVDKPSDGGSSSTPKPDDKPFNPDLFLEKIDWNTIKSNDTLIAIKELIQLSQAINTHN